MMLAFAAPLIFAAKFELSMSSLIWSRRIRRRMAGRDLLGNFIERNTAQSRNCTREKFIDNFTRQTNCLKYLRARI